jgi:hypothetical protein
MNARQRARSLVATVGAIAVIGAVLAAPADATAPGIRWDSDGTAEIVAPPFTFGLELTDYSSPAEITQRQVVRVDLSAETDVDACTATIRATPTLDGVPIGEPAYLDAVDSYDYVTLRFPVDAPGSYALQIEGSVETGSYLCLSGPTTSTPYSTSIELFRLDSALPGPASTRRVTITSSGPHTLVANTWSKSQPIRITYTIKDPERRNDLLHSICMQDTSDCWFEDARIVKRSYIRKTATGWVRTWDFWWERSSPSDCLAYYWDQPDVSVILIVSNRDGKELGRKRHTVKLTCRS